MKRRRWHHRREAATGCDAGFTLLEFVVAIALLTLLTALIPEALRLANRALRSTTAMTKDTSGAVALKIVETTLEAAMPLIERNEDGALRVAFSGRGDGVSFVAPFEAGPHGAGLYRFEIAMRENGGADAAVMVLRIFPFSARTGSGLPAQVLEERVVASGASGPSFRYYGRSRDSTTLGWQETWRNADRLPDLVELRPPASKNGAGWPAITVELKLRQQR